MPWSRPNGPLKIWSVKDLKTPDGKIKKFTFQEIPQDRYDEAVEHMCTKFVKDEIMCACCNVIDDPASMAMFREFWVNAIAMGISVAAFEEVDNGEKPILAGMNVLIVVDKDDKDKLADDVPMKAKKVLGVVENLTAEADPIKVFKVDRYLSAYGLSVDRKYRGVGLGKHLLELRDQICPAYDIPLTGTVFTSETSQRLAGRAGFQDHHTRYYHEMLDDKGEAFFPTLADKPVKLMVKHYPKS